VSIRGQKVYLRKVSSQDASLILEWENNPNFWDITENEGPFTLEDINYFIKSSTSLDASGQLRYMVVNLDNCVVGAVDLFDYNPMTQSAGVGILIAKSEDRTQGYATDALMTLIRHARNGVQLKQLHCIIYPSNIASIKLFSRCGFVPSGITTFKGKQVQRYTLHL
jgi:diamine N-acetyltransferase